MDAFPTEWELFGSTNNGLSTYRLRVVGGWLVMIRDLTNSTSHTNFVTDPQHTWVASS